MTQPSPMTMDKFKTLCNDYLEAIARAETRIDIIECRDFYQDQLDKDWGFLFYMISRWEYDVETWLKNN